MLYFILGSGLVYFAPERNATFALTFTNTSSNGYCDEAFFKFSFWSFSSVYISLGLLILVGLVSFSCSEYENDVKVKVYFKFSSRFDYILVLFYVIVFNYSNKMTLIK